jgi:hypothetical protein
MTPFSVCFSRRAGRAGTQAHYLSLEVLYSMLAMDSIYLQ